MSAQGIQVTYFASDQVPVHQQALADAGATLLEYRQEAVASEDRMVAAFCPPLAPLLDDLRALQPPPDVLIYDPFYPAPIVMGEVLDIPTVALVVNTGPGCTKDMETEQYIGAFQGVRAWVKEHYSVDLFHFGVPISSWYSRTLNVVLTCQEFFEGPSGERQLEKFGSAPFECVGSLVDPTRSKRPGMTDFPLDEIKAARDAGKKVVLLSLGSEITSTMWCRPCPLAQGNDDGTEVGGKTLATMTGKEIAHFIWNVAFKALGGNDDLLVIMVIGKLADPLEGLSLPDNFRAFAAVPQLEVLPLCSAFITHGGMGSTMESLIFRVPVIVVPAFGDQMANAENAAKSNLGFSFRYPLSTLSPEALGKAVQAVSDGRTLNPYREAVDAFATKMERSGGVSKAIERILAVAASYQHNQRKL
jgi:hypothetical protein